MGEFVDLLTELATTVQFRNVVNLPSQRLHDGTPQDYVLRFFAFKDQYKDFDHSVKDFLNDYCRDASLTPNLKHRRAIFIQAFELLEGLLPDGIRRSRQSITPVNLFEAVAVGAALALERNPRLPEPASVAWIDSPELTQLTTGATNDRRRVVGRIEFARDRFLSGG